MHVLSQIYAEKWTARTGKVASLSWTEFFSMTFLSLAGGNAMLRILCIYIRILYRILSHCTEATQSLLSFGHFLNIIVNSKHFIPALQHQGRRVRPKNSLILLLFICSAGESTTGARSEKFGLPCVYDKSYRIPLSVVTPDLSYKLRREHEKREDGGRQGVCVRERGGRGD